MWGERSMLCGTCGAWKTYPRVWFGVVPPVPICPYGCDAVRVTTATTTGPLPAAPHAAPAPQRAPRPGGGKVIPFPGRQR